MGFDRGRPRRPDVPDPRPTRSAESGHESGTRGARAADGEQQGGNRATGKGTPRPSRRDGLPATRKRPAPKGELRAPAKRRYDVSKTLRRHGAAPESPLLRENTMKRRLSTMLAVLGALLALV